MTQKEIVAKSLNSYSGAKDQLNDDSRKDFQLLTILANVCETFRGLDGSKSSRRFLKTVVFQIEQNLVMTQKCRTSKGFPKFECFWKFC